MKNREKIFKTLLTIMIALGSIYLLKYAKLEYIRKLVLSYGKLGDLVYVLCWVILPVFLFPVPILAMAGGIIFGLVKGSILTMIGALINTAIMYFISRYLAKDLSLIHI